MSYPELSDEQLLEKATVAIRKKDKKGSQPFLAEYGKRSLSKVKAKVANDPD
uniref:hypothetical protein n=1 Tax=Sphingomonas populi TaxID=2484750 RepID=UPI0013EEAEBA|nr:hypothetical protein [Sphingomonas populi]